MAFFFFFTFIVHTGKNQSRKVSLQNVLCLEAARCRWNDFSKLFYKTCVSIAVPQTSWKYFALCRENSDFMLGRILSNIYKHKIRTPALHAYIMNTHADTLFT